MNFSNIIITNVTTQKVIQTLPFTAENEKKADAYARAQNITNPHNGMVTSTTHKEKIHET